MAAKGAAMGMCACDESDEGNGCMDVIPRTHDNGFSEYDDVDPNKNVFVTEIRKGQFDESITRGKDVSDESAG
jgi:hypothetical protein